MIDDRVIINLAICQLSHFLMMRKDNTLHPLVLVSFVTKCNRDKNSICSYEQDCSRSKMYNSGGKAIGGADFFSDCVREIINSFVSRIFVLGISAEK